MSTIIESILNPVRQAHNLGPMLGKEVGELSEYSTIDKFTRDIGVSADPSTDDFMSLYESIPYVYRSVFVISSKIAELPVVIEELKGDEWVDVSDQPDFEIFKTYNNDMSHYDFWEQTLGYLSLTGECPWILKRTPSGKIVEMYPFSPEFLNIIPLNDFQVDHYYFQSGATQVRMEAEDIFFLKYFNPNNIVRGLSPLSAATNDIVLDLNAVTANQSMFKNGASPSGLISTKEEMDDPTWERTKDYLKTQHAGPENARKIMFLTNGLTWQQMSMSNQDLQYMDQRKMSRKTVGMVYGVPDVFLMDFSDASVLANADIQYKLLWDTLQPLTIKLAQVFTEHLIPQMTSKSNVRFRFDTTGVSALQPDLAAKSLRFNASFVNGACSPNDIRVHILGLEADPDPAMGKKYISNSFIPVGESAPVVAPVKNITDRIRDLGDNLTKLMPAGDQISKIIKAGESLAITHKDAKQMIWRAAADRIIAETLAKVAPPFEKDLEKLFVKQAKQVAANLSSNKGIPLIQAAKIIGLNPGINKDYKKHDHIWAEDYECYKAGFVRSDLNISFKYTVDGVGFNYKQWVKEFEDAGEPHIAEALAMAAVNFSESIGETFDLTDPVSTKYVQARSHEYASMVNTTTKDRINQLVAEGLEKGLSVAEMAATLEGYFENNNAMRATRIARTEAVNANNAGRVQAMLQSKRVKQHMWLSSRNARVRPQHKIADGEVVKVGEPFPSNTDGIDAAWPSSINEHCGTIPVDVDPKA